MTTIFSMHLKQLCFVIVLLSTITLFAQTSKQDLDALYEIGYKYWDNYDYEEAIPYFQKAAEKGHLKSQFLLGEIIEDNLDYWFDEEVEEREVEEYGKTIIKRNITRYYSYTIGDAIYWYEKAAKQNHIEAQYRLGKIYYNLSEKEASLAFYWSKSATLKGHKKAQLILAKCYFGGWGCDQNIEEAFKLLKELVESNDIEAQKTLSECYYKHGMSYFKGSEVEKDFNKASFYLLKGAELGESNAQYAIGECYYYGYGVEKSIENAIHWWTLSAENPTYANGTAMYNLGVLYYKGTEVEKDTIKGINWLKKSARAANHHAQRMLMSLGFKFGSWLK